MNILESLTELELSGKFNKASLLESQIDSEMLFFTIGEIIANNTPDYTDLFPVFQELREIELSSEKMNIFEQYLVLKFNYLHNVYKVNYLLLNALAHLLGIVYLDYEMEGRYFSDDKFFAFYMKRYDEFKHSNELSALKILSQFDVDSLKVDGEQLSKMVLELQELAK